MPHWLAQPSSLHRGTARRRWRPVALAAVALALLVACAATPPGSDPSSSSTGDGPPTGELTSAPSSPTPTQSPTARPTFPEDDFARLVRAVAGDGEAVGELDLLWERVLAAEGVDDYAGPAAVISYRGGEEVPPSACSLGTGIGFWRQNARYCPSDRSVLYDEIWLRDFADKAGDFAPAAILAHEWGHHIQELLATRGFDIQLELQADCFAGMYLGTSEQVVDGAYEIRVEELNSGLETFFAIGNREYAEDSWFQAYEHGSQNQRMLAFGSGYLGALGDYDGLGELVNGYPWCAGYAEFVAGDVRQIGPYSLLNPPGRTVTETTGGYALEPAAQSRQPTSRVTLRWLPALPLAADGATLDQLRAVVEAELPGTVLLYDPQPMDRSGARAIAHYFERSATTPAGDVQSGLVYLQLPEEPEGGLLIVVERPQAAVRDPATREKLATVAEHTVSLNQIINRLCAPHERVSSEPGTGNIACLTEQ